MKRPGWRAEIVGVGDRITSMNGVTIQPQQPLSFVQEADAVLFGSGTQTRRLIQDESLMSALQLDPDRQLIGAQCSGALILKRLGLVEQIPVCMDSKTRPWLIAAGAEVVEQPFLAVGNLATAGECLASQYLAA
ncbi:MAG: DJ-1/PfpI family protein [Oculatellaceae cyanobacterium Prado106]|nr:DJ-1/PfpI family protein [Oculatellaceae cyanobacterium Prado106]